MASKTKPAPFTAANLVFQFDQLADLRSQIEALQDQYDELNTKLIKDCQNHRFTDPIEATTCVFTLTEPKGSNYDVPGILSVLTRTQLAQVTERALVVAKFKAAYALSGWAKPDQNLGVYITPKDITPYFTRTVKA